MQYSTPHRKSQFSHSFLTIIILFITVSSFLSAGQTGKIAGRVNDAKTNEGIIGASVIVQGTRMGASTDIEGDYYITNVDPGTYVVEVSVLGYKKAIVRNVIVKIDLTTQIDVTLEESAVIGDEVIIQAERPLVQKDLTSSSVTVSAEEIKAMPVENINQVINLQAGVVGGHFRGGRSGEVAYLIDGLPINNPANGNAGFVPENSSIREMEVISGTFNAEYGQAMSGIVNIVTQDGGDRYNGSISLYLGDYYTTNRDLFKNLDKLNITRSKNFQFSLSGPTQIDKDLTFFITGRYFNNQGHLYGIKVFNVNDDIVPLMDPSGTQIRDTDGIFAAIPGFITDEATNVYRIIRTGDSTYVPMNPSQKYSANGKLTYSFSEFKISYSLFYEDNFNKYYDHSFQLTPDGIMNHYSINRIHSLVISHVPSSSTFQSLKFSLNKFRGYGYLYANPFDLRYVDPSRGLPKTNYTFRSGGNIADRYLSETQSIIGQWSLSSQLTKEHKIGLGIEGRLHRLYRHDQTLINTTRDLYDSLNNQIFTRGYSNLGTIGNQSYVKDPYEISAYIQDKMEYGDMIINAGVRMDYFNPNAKYLVDLQNPPSAIDVNGVPLVDSNYANFGKYKSASEKVQVSPRLGVSFPITDQGIIHFSYGHFFQIPNYENLYYNSDYLVQAGASLSAVTGNPDLNAQRTTSYELGLQQAFYTNLSLDFTVYYRDIRNLLGTEILITHNGTHYARYVNRDYGNIRGFIISLERRYADYFSLRADYTYQIAEGDASDPLSTFYNNQSNPPVETNKSLVPLNWDQRSTLNINLTVGDIGNWTAGFIFQYGSGFPYTPDTRISLLRFENGSLKPETYNLDLRLEKNVQLGSGMYLSLFALVYNILDIRNEYGVDAASGRANVDLFTEQNAQKIIGVNTIAQYQNNPSTVSGPREIRVGFNFGF